MKGVRSKAKGVSRKVGRGIWLFYLIMSAAVLGLLATNDAVGQMCTPPPPGMVSWWPGDGNADDMVGGNNGTLVNGATFAPGMVGQAFSFDGVNDFVRVSHNANLNPGSADFTIDFWMRTTSSVVAILNKRPVCAHSSFWGVRFAANTCIELDQDAAGTNYNPVCSTIPVNDGSWHHMAFVRQSVTATLYIDGAVRGSGSTSGVTNIVNTADLLFGNDPCVQFGDGTQFYPGELDEIEYFNRALTQTEIQAIFQAGSAGKCKVADTDGDGVPDNADNCPDDPNSDQTDTDGDSAGDACDADIDGDGVLNGNDNCPLNVNPNQTDTDSDGVGNTCDDDDDNDSVLDNSDNCPLNANSDQTDTDGDGNGNACDNDDDNDGVLDGNDNCPLDPNANQNDLDGDGIGDACENDTDGDGVDNSSDNCPLNANPDQTNTDGDGSGDACDTDDDNDGFADDADNCPLNANSDQTDTDGDGEGNACDADDDGDSVGDDADNCPLDQNFDQANNDGDNNGDICDADDDNDGVLDGNDNCPFTANANQADADGDGEGNACDGDADGDGVPNDADNCPLNPNADQSDLDEDGLGDVCDDDIDDDGVMNDNDNCPASDLSPTVVVGSCDSGVVNRFFNDGCTISDLIAECAVGATNHGDFVNCVAHLLNDLKNSGVITGQQKGAIQNCAAQADIP